MEHLLRGQQKNTTGILRLRKSLLILAHQIVFSYFLNFYRATDLDRDVPMPRRLCEQM